MTSHPLQLYSAFLDGHVLSESEAERLRAWIAEDPRHAVELVNIASVHAAITDRLMLGRLLDDLAAHRSDAIVTQASLAEAIREIETNSPRVAAPVTLPPAPVEQIPMAYVVAPILAVFAVALIGLWMLVSPGPEPGDHLAGRDVSKPVATAERPKPAVAGRVGATFDARWSSNLARNPGEVLFENTRMELLSGVVQLDMVSGAAVVLEGPAFVELLGSDSLRLQQGKVAVRIDGATEQFVVDTPTTRVIDLGTEFGVQSSAGGDSRVMVFDGAVSVGAVREEAGAAAAPKQGLPNRVGAGFEVSVPAGDDAGDAVAPPEPLVNARHFVRPDEVKVRLDALAGSMAAVKLAAHYQRQRIEGLLAYQGFDAPSGGADYVLGMGGQGLVAMANLQFVDAAVGAAGGVDVQNGPAFQMLDVTPEGPFGRAGLLTEAGLVGRSGGELWLTWRTRRLQGSGEHPESAGLSLMFGDRSDLDEPVFFGRGYGDASALRVETAWGGGVPPASTRVSVDVDGQPQAEGLQQQLVDDREHQWIARIEFQDGPDEVSVWLDTDVSEVSAIEPQAVLRDADVSFDRLRMAVHRPDETWRFSELGLAITPTALEDLAQVGQFATESKKIRANYEPDK